MTSIGDDMDLAAGEHAGSASQLGSPVATLNSSSATVTPCWPFDRGACAIAAPADVHRAIAVGECRLLAEASDLVGQQRGLDQHQRLAGARGPDLDLGVVADAHELGLVHQDQRSVRPLGVLVVRSWGQEAAGTPAAAKSLPP